MAAPRLADLLCTLARPAVCHGRTTWDPSGKIAAIEFYGGSCVTTITPPFIALPKILPPTRWLLPRPVTLTNAPRLAPITPLLSQPFGNSPTSLSNTHLDRDGRRHRAYHSPLPALATTTNQTVRLIRGSVLRRTMAAPAEPQPSVLKARPPAR